MRNQYWDKVYEFFFSHPCLEVKKLNIFSVLIINKEFQHIFKLKVMVLSQKFLLDYNLLLLPSGMLLLPWVSDLSLFWTENFWPKKSCTSSLLIRNGFLPHQMSGQWEDYWRTTRLRSCTRGPGCFCQAEGADAWKKLWSRQKSSVSGVFVSCHSDSSTKEKSILFSFGLLDIAKSPWE